MTEPRAPAGLECDDARLLASLALDGIVDDLLLKDLWEHLGTCLACARFAAELGYATALVRSAPHVPFRGELASPRLLRSRVEAHRGPWATAAVVLVAVGLGISHLTSASHGPSADERRGADVAAPFRLPIGQRSAAADFALGRPYVGRADRGADRDLR